MNRAPRGQPGFKMRGAGLVLAALFVPAGLCLWLLGGPLHGARWLRHASFVPPPLLPCLDASKEQAGVRLDDPAVALLQRRTAHCHEIEDVYDVHAMGLMAPALSGICYSIPKIIHQIWLGESPPPRKWIDTWAKDYVQACPGWQHRLWMGDDVLTLRYPDWELVRLDGELAARADVLKVALIQEHGGVYVDADIVWINGRCLDPLVGLAATTGLMLALEPPRLPPRNPDWLVATSVIGGVRHHPFLKYYNTRMANYTVTYANLSHFHRSGPRALTRALLEPGALPLQVPPACPAGKWFDPTEHAASIGASSSAYSVRARSVLPAHALLSAQRLVTVVDSRYFYPLHWMGGFDARTYKLDGAAFPDAFMFQWGYTSNNLTTEGNNLAARAG